MFPCCNDVSNMRHAGLGSLSFMPSCVLKAPVSVNGDKAPSGACSLAVAWIQVERPSLTRCGTIHQASQSRADFHLDHGPPDLDCSLLTIGTAKSHWEDSQQGLNGVLHYLLSAQNSGRCACDHAGAQAISMVSALATHAGDILSCWDSKAPARQSFYYLSRILEVLELAQKLHETWQGQAFELAQEGLRSAAQFYMNAESQAEILPRIGALCRAYAFLKPGKPATSQIRNRSGRRFNG